ncbi:MAG: type II secretion system F family protein, partial [Planctomycetota bacterium]
QGALISGSITSDSRESVANILRQKGYFLLTINKQNKTAAFISRIFALPHRVTIRDKAVFTQQLATLLKAAMRLSTALKTLAKQTPNRHLATVIQQLHNDIEHSNSLSQAMAAHPGIFSDVYLAIVEAAEQSGTLPESLTEISQRLKATAKLDSQIRAALAYPIFLLVISIAIVAALSALVVPKFIRLFVNTNQQLPIPTKILVTITNCTQQLWPLMLAVAVTAVIVALTALKDKKVRFAFDALLLKAPAIGKLIQKRQIARFARTLGSLLKGGVRIIEALTTAKKAASNRAFTDQITNLLQAVTKGNSIANTMNDLSSFDEMTTSMVAVGEDSGMLPEMLIEIADIYDQQSKDAITAMTNMIGPVLIVLLGLIIGFVVMAILLPIFQTSTMLT